MKILKKILMILPSIILVGVGIYFIITTIPFVRYWVDDLCSSAFVRNNGFWGAQIASRNTWTGRFSYIFFVDAFEVLGPWTVKILPIAIAVLATLALVPLFSFEIILAPLFVVLTLINAPNIIQSFYWQVGSCNYAVEFILLNLFLSLFLLSRRKLIMPLAFILTFIAGGFSESYALAQIVLIFIIGLIIFIGNFEDKKFKIKLIMIGLFGAMLSLITIYIAPGNAVRSLMVTHPSSFMFVIKSTIYGTKWYLQRMLLVKPFVYSLIISASVIFMSVERNWKIFSKLFFGIKKTILIMFMSLLLAIFSTASVIFASYYAQNITPPERAMFIVIYMILISFFIFCFAGSIIFLKYLKKNVIKYFIYIAILTNIIFSILLIKSVMKSWENVRTEIRNYAIQWDEQDKILIKAFYGDKYATIKDIKAVGELDGFVDNNGWVLGCVKEYYQLKEIKLK